MSTKENFCEVAGFTPEKYDETIAYIRELLSRCRYSSTVEGLEANLAMWVENKAPLVKMLQNMTGYNGNLQAVVPMEFDPEMDGNAVYNCVTHFLDRIDAYGKVVSKFNADGKDVTTIIKEACEEVPHQINLSSLERGFKIRFADLNEFDSDNYTFESKRKYNRLCDTMSSFSRNAKVTVPEDLSSMINGFYPEMKPQAVEGMKMSKLFNRIFTHYSLQNDGAYQKEFAKYSDLVSGNPRRLKFVISCNPIDYLQASHGVNWQSCHSVEHHGGWHAGCLSYMMDGTTFITYVVSADADVNHPEFNRSIYRCMFHYKDGWLLQPRIYPQGNDGATDLYAKFRNQMQKSLGEGLGTPDVTWVRKKDSDMHIYARTGNGAKQYEDYFCQAGRNISYIKGVEELGSKMVIGTQPFCVNCGRPISSTSNLYCGRCR